ncbi:hypothetical protein CEXT_407041 [Caerostris extrusa]|uniref:Uncharacterized protein n=1 Tax=Caerostris extrusa TaxID=172846 RepID=A0AAV4XWA4_CAEEX|nr:hypothetical protein CEXT_407041 [Caerostris extrusa]
MCESSALASHDSLGGKNIRELKEDCRTPKGSSAHRAKSYVVPPAPTSVSVACTTAKICDDERKDIYSFNSCYLNQQPWKFTDLGFLMNKIVRDKLPR